MAVPIEARGQIQDFLDVLRRRAWQIAVPAVFVIVIGACITAIVPRKFLARTQLELRQVGNQGAVREGPNANFQILAPARIKRVVEELKDPVYLALEEAQRREFLRDVQSNLRVDVNAPGMQSSIFITIRFADIDRTWAGTFLRALRDDWKEDVLERDKNKLNDERKKFGEDRENLERRLHQEEQDLANHKRTHGISATQPIPGISEQRSEDPEFDRLQTAKNQLQETLIALGQAKAAVDTLEKRLKLVPPRLSSEEIVQGVTHEDEIRKIETQILDLQEKLRGYGRMNSRFRKLQDEIAALERRKQDLEGLVTRGELTRLSVVNPDYGEVQRELARARDEVTKLEAAQRILNGVITDAQRTVSDLHDAYKEVREREEKIRRLQANLKDVDGKYQDRLQQVELSQGPRGNPFAILEEVSIPPKPTEPNPLMLMAFSIVAGLGLGVGLAVLLEYSKSCFRSVYDVSRVMVVPVLGNINSIVTRREARIRRTRRLAVGAASFFFLGTLGFVTWAWSVESPLLSPSLRNAIEDLRSALK